MMDPRMSPADVLRDAARVLESKGWCQNEMVEADGRRCALGAISSTNGGHLAMSRAQSALAKHVGVREVAPWNDLPGRTREDVIKAMLGAADEVEVQ